MSATTPSSETVVPRPQATVRPVIQVGIDGAWREAGALEWALRESLLRREPLRAVHVVDERTKRTRYYEPVVTAQADADLVDDVRDWMKRRDDDLGHEAVLMAGSPAAALTDAAQGSRMLVVGRRGIGAFKRLVLGSTSEAVTNLGQGPVIVVPDGWTAPANQAPVLVAMDDSDDDEAAVEFAVELAVERNVPLRLVHVWDLPAVYGWNPAMVMTVEEDWTATADLHWEAVAKHWRRKYPELEIQLDVRRGHPVERLLDAAQAVDAQIVVLGGHHRRHLSTVLLGSVSRGVLQHATCPVAVVHCERR